MSRDRTTTVATWLLIACGVLLATAYVVLGLSVWHEFTTDTALYELETGEYLHCTPQGGNHLECTVAHRKDNH